MRIVRVYVISYWHRVFKLKFLKKLSHCIFCSRLYPRLFVNSWAILVDKTSTSARALRLKSFQSEGDLYTKSDKKSYFCLLLNKSDKMSSVDEVRKSLVLIKSDSDRKILRVLTKSEYC